MSSLASQAQDPRLQVGVGVLPGVGGFAARSAPTLFVLTQEVALYSDVTLGDNSRILVAAGVGGAVQINRILELAQNRRAGVVGFDVGIRLGPSFYYSLTDQSAEQEVRSFRVMFDPFVRGTYRMRSGRVFFVELGAQAPDFRLGLSVGL